MKGSRSSIFLRSAERSFALTQRASRVLRKYIREYRPQKGWLFEKPDGSAYSVDEILHLLNQLAERVKIDRMEPMGFRVSMASASKPVHAPEKLTEAVSPESQFDRLKNVHDQCFRHPLEEMTRRERDMNVQAVEKIYVALAKKAGQ